MPFHVDVTTSRRGSDDRPQGVRATCRNRHRGRGFLPASLGSTRRAQAAVYTAQACQLTPPWGNRRSAPAASRHSSVVQLSHRCASMASGVIADRTGTAAAATASLSRSDAPVGVSYRCPRTSAALTEDPPVRANRRRDSVRAAQRGRVSRAARRPRMTTSARLSTRRVGEAASLGRPSPARVAVLFPMAHRTSSCRRAHTEAPRATGLSRQIDASKSRFLMFSVACPLDRGRSRDASPTVSGTRRARDTPRRRFCASAGCLARVGLYRAPPRVLARRHALARALGGRARADSVTRLLQLHRRPCTRAGGPPNLH